MSAVVTLVVRSLLGCWLFKNPGLRDFLGIFFSMTLLWDQLLLGWDKMVFLLFLWCLVVI
jgi:hypothetical protein